MPVTLCSPALPLALYGAAQVRAMDQCAIHDHALPGATLMARAGAACLEALRERWPRARTLLVACGAGNNAGDGYVLARLAQAQGLAVEVGYLVAPDRLGGDAGDAARHAIEASVPMRPFADTEPAAADVIVDALLGTGLDRPLGGAWAEAVARINACGRPVLAADLPTGLGADSGCVMGAAVRADLTVVLIGLKLGLFTGQGRAYAGEVRYADLGVPAEVLSAVPAAWRYAGEDLPKLLPPRDRAAHKGHYGHLLVVGGDAGMAGAARLAAEAGARCGAGLVSVATRGAHAAVQAAARPELMFRGVEDETDLDALLPASTVVVVGPGLGRGVWGRALLRAVLQAGRRLVVDADALNQLAEAPAHRGDWVLTPHPGEAARLLGVGVAEVEADRLAAAKAIAGRYGGVCVLKGAGTVVVAQRAGPWVCAGGNPGMACGGMGDVLSGVIGALLAQGLGLAEAARLGVWLHGRAADIAVRRGGERGLLAGDLLVPLRQLVNGGDGDE